MNYLSTLAQSRGKQLTEEAQKEVAGMSEKYGVDKKRRTEACAAPNEIVILFDATGSMRQWWEKAKSAIDRIMENIHAVSQTKIRLVAYRDYDDGNNLLQYSESTDDAVALERFIGLVHCHGGGRGRDDYPEAVEAALDYLLENIDDGTPAILIGDAPPHGVVNEKKSLYYKDVCRSLAQKRHPVYTMTIGNGPGLKDAFADIAAITGGKCMSIDDIGKFDDLMSMVCAHQIGAMPSLLGLLAKRQGGALTIEQKRIRALLE